MAHGYVEGTFEYPDTLLMKAARDGRFTKQFVEHAQSLKKPPWWHGTSDLAHVAEKRDYAAAQHYLWCWRQAGSPQPWLDEQARDDWWEASFGTAPVPIPPADRAD